MESIEAKILIKNICFPESIFDTVSNPVYVIKTEKIRKVFSDNAVVELNTEHITGGDFKSREAEDLDIYGDVDDQYNPFANSYGKEIQGDAGLITTNTNFYYCEKQSSSCNNLLGPESENIENNLEIFKNCSSSQMNQLKKMFNTINSTPENKVIVKAYRSKLKSKFYEIYEKNSEKVQEKIKYKIFHKCNFPSCGRTFASAGWLRSHFKEHLKEIKKNKFNILFENLMLNFNQLIYLHK